MLCGLQSMGVELVLTHLDALHISTAADADQGKQEGSMQRLLTAHGVALDAHASKGAERTGACR